MTVPDPLAARELVGGLRARLLQDSLYHTINDALGELGWYDQHRQHQSLRFLAKPLRWDQAVQPNLIAMQIETVELAELELGSGLTEDEIAVLFDCYLENESVGAHLTNDLRDLLRGRHTVGPQHPVFDLYDYRQATPPTIGYAVIDEVRIERSSALVQQDYARHWYQVRCLVHDVYTNDWATI